MEDAMKMWKKWLLPTVLLLGLAIGAGPALAAPQFAGPQGPPVWC
jgi:hypothetical protein